MTAAKVVDASALGAIAFGEAEAASVLGKLAEAELVAPRLLLFELGNIAWKKATREPGKSGLILEALALALRAPITLLEVDLLAVTALALEERITVYDASYLWISRERGLPLVTLDRKLGSLALRGSVRVGPGDAVADVTRARARRGRPPR